ncbi:MAG: PEGA domain-containing protein [Methanoregula sp.]|nr:PEGA domain-containing protein [Methanoregula sp.]
MSRASGFYTIPLVVFLTLLILALPVGAYNVSIYGNSTGFNPDFHKDSVVVVQSIGPTGSVLDSTINQFTQSSTDVILLGGEDTFSPATAATIEAAVAEGRILVVAYPCNHLFNTSLPATSNGTATGGAFLAVSDPALNASKEIFMGFPTQFFLQGAGTDTEQVIARNGSVILLKYDNGMPALLYTKYGKGYVIEWATRPVPSYMNGEAADTILDRLITRLLPAPAIQPTTSATQQKTTVVTIPPVTNATALNATTVNAAAFNATPLNPVPPEVPVQTTGNVTVYSSPIGTSILIDGIYYGTTPANLTGIQQGNHILRLTQSGYYDYEGSIYVIPGQTSHAFGTLPPLNPVQAAATQVSIIVPVVTAETTPVKGPLENTSVVVAIIGVVTAMIAAGATIFSHIMKAKKE